MLQAIRSRTAGIVVKILFALLVLSFAVWGIGDYAFLRRSDDVAIRVGDAKITAEQVADQYRREMDRLRRSLGQFDPEMARQFGLLDQVVDRMINDAAFQLEAERLGIVVTDDMIRREIANTPAFRGLGGNFDRNVFQRVLFENGLTEGQYVALLRRDLQRLAIADAIGRGAEAPEVLVDRLFRYREERRVAETVLVQRGSFDNVGEPDEAQLRSAYDDNKDELTQPEYRALTVVRIGVEELAASMQPSEQQLQEEFQQRQAEFRVAERRSMEQMVFPTEAAAAAAAEKTRAGAPFLEVAREDANLTADQATFEDVARDELVPELAGPVFSANEGDIVGPVQSPLGWHVFRITKVEPGREPSFAELRDRLRGDVAARLAADSAYDAATKVEDAVAGGAPLEDAARRAGVEAVKVAAVSARGLTPDGQPAAVFVGAPEALEAAFQTPQGETSQLIETKSGMFLLVRVDSITPPRTPPLEEVRARVVELWKAEQRGEAARRRAEDILAAVEKGGTLAEAAAPFNLKPTTTPAIRRDGAAEGQGRFDPQITGQMFSLKPGGAAVVAGRDGYHVVRLTDVRPADPAADAEAVQQLRAQLGGQIGADMVQEMATALRTRYGVSIDRAVLDRLL